MKFKPFLLIYLGLIYCNCADLKLTVENVTLPTKIKTKYVDMLKYDKLTINDTATLRMTFKFEAKNNLKEKTTQFFFNDELINFQDRKDIVQTPGEVEMAQMQYHLDFPKFSEKVVGKYTMKIVTSNDQEINATGHIFSPPFLQEFQESKRRVEGGRLEVICRFTSNPALTQMKWSSLSSKHNFRDIKSSNVSRFKDIIIWDLLEKGDSGYYKCNASNEFGNDTVILQLRVKDRLAPLWPFLGIIIELAILIIIIVVYERRKMQKKSAEADVHPARESLLDSRKKDENEEVRHRNPVA